LKYYNYLPKQDKETGIRKIERSTSLLITEFRSDAVVFSRGRRKFWCSPF